MIIDVHTHYLTCEHWGEEYPRYWAPAYGGASWEDVDPAAFDAAMAEQGVDTAIVFGLRATRAGVQTPHEEIAAFVSKVSTPAVGFMALDLADDDVLDQLELGISLGLRGVKLYPVVARTDPRDRAYDAFYGAAQDAGLVLLWHMGTTPSSPGDLLVSQPMVLDDVATRFPNLTMIIAHMGHPWQRESVVLCRKHPRVFTDVSGVPSRPLDAFLALVRAQEWNVTDKLLFGSDYPLWTPAQAVAGLRRIAAMRAGDLPHVLEETVEDLIERDSLALLGLR